MHVQYVISQGEISERHFCRGRFQNLIIILGDVVDFEETVACKCKYVVTEEYSN